MAIEPALLNVVSPRLYIVICGYTAAIHVHRGNSQRTTLLSGLSPLTQLLCKVHHVIRSNHSICISCYLLIIRVRHDILGWPTFLAIPEGQYRHSSKTDKILNQRNRTYRLETEKVIIIKIIKQF